MSALAAFIDSAAQMLLGLNQWGLKIYFWA